MNIRGLVISLFLFLVLFVLGLFLGIAYQARKTPVQPPIQTQDQSTPDSIKVLSSDLISAITAHGIVTKIDGSDITINRALDSRTIRIRNDARVFRLVVSTPRTATTREKYESKEVAMRDIKNGDNLAIALRVLSNGKIEGSGVTILPAGLDISQ